MLGVYGWTRNTTGGIVEYWILESYGSLNPGSGMIRKGSTTCLSDGVALRYDIYYVPRPYNFPPIEGEENYQQFWSIRSPRRGKVKGTVDTDCHFSAWRDLGMELGEKFAYQIFMTDGYYSSGNATITVS
jgi:endo-1,4-beta-xylanase